MKKLSVLFIMLASMLPVFSCSSSSTVQGGNSSSSGGRTPVVLTIGDTVLDAYLEDSVPARSLIEQLPMTVTVYDSDNDFCGDNISIEYSSSDVTYGYKNGDIYFWTPANNFVIFVSGEENSAGTGNLVKLGHITSPQEMLDSLSGTLNIQISLKESVSAGGNMRIKITAGDSVMYADFEDNVTARALISRMPMTLPMMDLYGREMCYRFGNGSFATDSIQSDGYEVGDIAYWPPAGSLVILYDQNGEHFSRQHIGHIDSGTEIFRRLGDTEVRFELVE